MKTLADFKRKLKPGSKWNFRSHWTNGVNYTRVVNIRQSNAVALTSVRDPKENSWLYWPKAKDCIFHNGGVYIVENNKDIFLKALNEDRDVTKSAAFYLYYEPIEEAI